MGDAPYDFGRFLRSIPPPHTSGTQANPASSEQAPNAAAQSQSTSVAQLSRQSSAVRQSLARSGSALATGTKLTLEDKLAARAHSGAANALAAAAATSRTMHTSPANAPEGAGVAIPSGTSTFKYGAAQHTAEEQKPELKVAPVTVIRTEPFYERQQRIAVSDDYICYSLKAGQIRVLNRHISARALLKGASQPPTVMFPTHSCNQLASADKSGRVTVWDIRREADAVDGREIGTFILSGPPGAASSDGMPAPQAQVAFHVTDSTQPVLAMALGLTLYLASLDRSSAEPAHFANGAQEWDCTDVAALPLSSMTSMQLPHTLCCLSFNSSGSKLAAVSTEGQVLVWALPNNADQISKETALQTITEFQPDSQAKCSTVCWLSSTILIVGCADNSTVTLWDIADEAECLQTVDFAHGAQSSKSDLYLHMAVQPEAGIVVLADAKSPTVYALHINTTATGAQFDNVAEFVVGQPILSLAAHYTPAKDPGVLQLFCVQEKAIQIYTLNLAECQPAPHTASSRSVSDEADSAPIAAPSAPPNAESDLLRPAIASRQAVTATAPAPDQQQDAQAAAGSYSVLPAIISTPSAAALPEAPKLLTPKHLLQNIKRSSSQTSVSSTTGHITPKSLPASSSQGLDALAARLGSYKSAGTPGSVQSHTDNADVVSTTSTQGSLLTPGDLSRPASAQSGSTVPRSAATLDAEVKQGLPHKSLVTSPAGSRSSTPPPTTPAMPSAAYLTPEQYTGEPAAAATSSADATTEATSPTASAAENNSRNLFSDGLPGSAASPAQDISLLRRGDKGQEAAESQSNQGMSSSQDPSSAFEQPLDLLPISNAAPASPLPSILHPHTADANVQPTEQLPSQQQAQQQHSQLPQHQQPSAPLLQGQAETGTLQQMDLSDQSVRRIVDAVADRTLAQHKRMLSHLHDGHREMLRIIKADISKEGKRLQAAIEAQVSQLHKSQGSLVAEDRRAVLAEQQASMEQLVSLISASINRDLPLRMEGIVRAEVAALSDGLQQQLSPVLQTAVAEALPAQFASPQVRNALEASLNSQLQQAMAKPLQDSFTASFQEQLIPAFEGACRDMFAQVQATFAGGLSEHLQAAGGANASVAASLRESLGTAAQLVTDLKTDLQEGQNSLLQLATQRSGQRGSGFGNEDAYQDPRQECMALIREQRYEEAFHKVLSLEDISTVAWLCSQLDPGSLLSQNPPMLNQQILLPLIQQLGVDLAEDTLTKLRWIQSTALALNPQDPSLAPHVRPILEHLYRSLQQVLTGSSGREAAGQAQICLHLTNSLLHSCPA